jgi:acyl-CoA synthetase (AMP-forming)/AMP-acid ligase II
MIYDPEVQTLAALPGVQARRFPNRTAITCGERSITYAEFEELCSRLALVLQQRGVEPGQRVALLSKESIESAALVFAVARCGATIVPISWRLSAPEVAWIVDNAQCSTLLASPEFVALCARVGATCSVVAIDAELPLSRGSAPFVAPSVGPQDVAAHIYTSGTTGMPKGVELPHDSLFAIAREFHVRNLRWLGWSEEDVGLCLLPLFHVGGLWWLVRVLASGSHAVLLPQFVGWHAIEAIERHRVTKMAVVPAMLQLMISEPDAKPERFSSLRVVGYGGSPVPAGLLERARQFMPCDFHQVYGLTETGNMAVSLAPADHLVPSRRGSVGKALPGVQLKIVDEANQVLPSGAVGEICIKSPAVMRGYWQNPAATAATLEDGWIRSGDAGYLDQDGYLFICDRIKDMICCAGEKIWPAEVEQVLAEHPAVREIAVIGVPHDDWGEAVRAVVVLHPANPLELKELRSFARGRLADFKLPSSLELAETLPRTAAGKVQKKALRDAYIKVTTNAAI